MRQLIIAYIARNWRRDLLMLLLMPACAFGAYAYYSHYGITSGITRHRIAQLWVVFAAAYALFTAFDGYRSSKNAYAGLLLPASLPSKFIFEALRTLVAYPLITAIMILGLDMILAHTGIACSPRHMQCHDSLLRSLTYSSLPLYHMPVMPYYLLASVSIATLIRSISKQYALWILGIACVVALLLAGAPGGGAWAVKTVYPFASDTIALTSGRTIWIEPVTWTRLPMRTLEILSCAWLMLIPVFAYALAYLNIKELSLRR